MGWSNYVIVPTLKLLIEVSRDVDNIKDYEIEDINKAIGEENLYYEDDSVDMGNIKINDITIKDLTFLYDGYKIVQAIAGLNANKLLLFWLKSREIDHEVKSQFDINIDELKTEGYVLVER